MKLTAIQPETIAAAARAVLGDRLVEGLDTLAAEVVPFAQVGHPEAAIGRVVHALFMAPTAPPETWMRARLRLPEGEEIETPRGQLLAVVLAARGRMRLREGAIEVAELAALASCSTRNIRYAIARDHLQRVIDTWACGPITGKSAVRFLEERGVRPWGKAT
jgi:hypothetical protein